MNIKNSNIAIIHDWFLKKSFGGSEKVTLVLNNLLKERYSKPDIYSLTSNIESLKIKSFKENKIQTSLFNHYHLGKQMFKAIFLFFHMQ